MNSIDLIGTALCLKRAGALDTAGAGLSSVFGPVGTYAYSRWQNDSPADKWELVGRSALGAGLGGIAGSLAGIPISMATGVPFLPGMALGAGLGTMGGSLAAMLTRRKQHARKKPKKS